jgi:hypothetical protein
MSTVDLHVGDIGTPLRFTIKENNVPVDLSTDCQWKILHLEKKDKTVVDFPMYFVTDGVDGKVEYVTQEGDIDQKGKWKAQIFIGMTSGSWHTSIATLEVEDNICKDEEYHL